MAKTGPSTAISGALQRTEIAPLSKETVMTYGHQSTWDILHRSLDPVISRRFAVTDVATKAAVDEIRRVLDCSGTSSRNAVVRRIAASDVCGDAAMLRAVLEAGADPDIPNSEGWRASHSSSFSGGIEVLEVLYLCRHDMAAVNEDGKTPLQVALGNYALGTSKPWRSVLRPVLAEKMKARKYEEQIFPTIAELACHREWYAVRNVIRREVVPAWEYLEEFHGKSASEWALAFKEQCIAQEIKYFAKSAELKIRGEIQALQKKLVEQEGQAKSAELKIREEVQALQKKLAENDAKAKSAEFKIREEVQALQKKLVEKDTKAKSAELKIRGEVKALQKKLAEKDSQAKSAELKTRGEVTALQKKLAEKESEAKSAELKIREEVKALQKKLAEKESEAKSAELKIREEVKVLQKKLAEKESEAKSVELKIRGEVQALQKKLAEKESEAKSAELKLCEEVKALQKKLAEKESKAKSVELKIRGQVQALQKKLKEKQDEINGTAYKIHSELETVHQRILAEKESEFKSTELRMREEVEVLVKKHAGTVNEFKSTELRIREEVQALQKKLAEKDSEIGDLKFRDVSKAAKLRKVDELLDQCITENVILQSEVESLKKALADKEAATSTGKRSLSAVSGPADESCKRHRSSGKPSEENSTQALPK